MVIEGAAHALGAGYDVQRVCTLNRLTISSLRWRIAERCAEAFSDMPEVGVLTLLAATNPAWRPYYQALGHKRGSCPAAEAVHERLTRLPIFPAMTNEGVEDVITAVDKGVSAYRKKHRG